MAPTWAAFRQWYPGIKQGRLQVTNTSGEPVTVTLQAASDSSSGCWYAPSWADAAAFPTAGVTVAAGQTSADYYTMGAYTAGIRRQLRADGTGTENDMWRGYLVVTPVNHPADARLVRLRLNPNMTVDVENQAGGATTVSIAPAPQQLAAFGLWTLTVDTPALPTPLSAPTVNASQITPDGTPVAAVYRFDVSGATFQLGTVVRRSDGDPAADRAGFGRRYDWTELGALVPAMAPSIVPQGNEFVLQVGAATFWWENPTGQPAYQQIRVGFGSSGPQSAVVTLADLAAPAPPTDACGSADQRHRPRPGCRAGRYRYRSGAVVGAGAQQQRQRRQRPGVAGQ